MTNRKLRGEVVMPWLAADPVIVLPAHREALEAGASPFDLTTVGVASSHDFACRRQYWRPRERAGTRRVAKDGAVLARAVATYTPEQICAVIAMTCEKPSESERPISHWSQREIADEAIRRGLVSNISQRSVGRFLKKRPTLNRTAFVTG